MRPLVCGIRATLASKAPTGRFRVFRVGRHAAQTFKNGERQICQRRFPSLLKNVPIPAGSDLVYRFIMGTTRVIVT